MKRMMWILLVFLGMTWPAFAAGFAPEPYPMPVPDRGIVRLQIIGDTWGELPIHSTGWDEIGRYRGGSGVIYVAKGERYRLSITNLTGSRLGLVIAVDGRNILTGESSYGRPNEGLYVLSPYASGQFTGWRTNMREVRRFYFTDADDSYAANLGDAGRIGQITVTAFSEEPRYPQPEISLSEDRAKASGRSESIRRDSYQAPGPGTGWGERDYSPVRETTFEPESSPSARYVIRYEWTRQHHHHRYPEPETRDFCPEPSRPFHGGSR